MRVEALRARLVQMLFRARYSSATSLRSWRFWTQNRFRLACVKALTHQDAVI